MAEPFLICKACGSSYKRKFGHSKYFCSKDCKIADGGRAIACVPSCRIEDLYMREITRANGQKAVQACCAKCLQTRIIGRARGYPTH